MTWGNWIVVSFIVFAVFIGVLVTVCVREDVNLVSRNYYQEDLAYEKQMDRLKNTESLPGKPDITVKGNLLQVQFGQLSDVENGTMKLFRPSDAKLDQLFTIEATQSTVVQFEVGNLQRGLYRAQMTWSMLGKEYYFEKIITL